MSPAPPRRRFASFLPATVLALLVAVLAAAPHVGVPGTTTLLLLAAPAPAVALPLSRLDPLGRVVAGLGAAIAVDTLVAEAMVTTRMWSPRGGAIAVGVLSVVLLLVLTRRPGGRVPAADADLREERPA